MVADNKEDEKEDTSSSSSKLLSVQLHPDYGRYVCASSFVPCKSLILDELPTMCAPWPIDDKVTFDSPLCLGCCMHMKLKGSPEDDPIDLQPETDEEYFSRLLSKVNRCTKCEWPVCSVDCEDIPSHRDNECQLFAQHQMPYPPPGENMNVVTTSVMIQLIRCLLLKKRKSPKWERLLQLQSETALGTRPWNFNLLLDDIKEIFPEIEDNLGSREECCKILAIININAFSNTFTSNGDFSGCSICLFLEASMLAHSCAPNCWWTLTEDPSHRIVIKSSDDIEKDSMISVCYSNQFSVYGTFKREEMFRNVGGFTCKCRRCLDPSELGSLASGVLCERCMTGYRLPEMPTDPESQWKCDLCGNKESAEVICTIVKALETRLFTILDNNKEPVPLLVRFLENCKSLVHNNHWIVTQTEDYIMKEWARDPDVRFGGGGVEDILITCEYFISLCFHVLSVRNLVSPGLSFHRARYLLFYARTRMARLEFMVNMLEHPKRYNLPPLPPSFGDWKKDESQFQIVREEFHEVLQLYHEVMEYRQMSCATDDEVKGEIEHLIKLLTPVVQMEPHHKSILRLVGVESENKEGDEGGNGDGSGCTLS